MLDFPGSPSTGDVYPTSGPPAWRFNGVGWQRINVITQLEDNGFWSNYGGDINRLGRVFIGAATQNTGDAPESTPDPIEQVRSFSVLSQLAVVSRVGLTAIYGGTRSSDWATDNSFSTIGVAGIALNDDTAHTMVAYGGFFHGYHYDGAWYTVGQEVDIANFASAPDVTPYDITPTHSSVAQILASSGAVAGTTDASAAQLIRNDGSAFKKGIVFENDALTGADGDGTGTGIAIEMALGQVIQWLPNGGQPVTLGSYGPGNVNFYWADNGADLGPNFEMFRDSASPAANDGLGSIIWFGRDSGASVQDYAYLAGYIVSPTAGAEYGRVSILTAQNGSVANRIAVGGGLIVGSPTGDDKGIGSINAQAVYDDNVLLTCAPIEMLADGGDVDLRKWDAMVPDDREHQTAHLFKDMIDDGFDPSDPDQYFAKMKADRALPGMPTQKTWEHGALSVGENFNRMALALDLLAVAAHEMNARIATLEGRA